MRARIVRSLSLTASPTLVVALVCAVAAPGAVAAPVPTMSVPTARVALPAAVDAHPGYQPQNSCDPVSRPGTTALGDLLSTTYGGGVVGYARSCVHGTTEHSDGRALDWMLDASDLAEFAIAERALEWMLGDDAEVAQRLGVQYIIWNKQIWRAYRPTAGWQPYRGRSPHTDHIHISLTWDGALKRTSWWTGTAITSPDRGTCRVHTGEYAPVYTGVNLERCGDTVPAPVSGKPTYVWGQSSRDIAAAQAMLVVSADGEFGPLTRAALFEYQERHALPRTGVLDQATWASLLAS